jgi:hypothetical protein
MLGVCLDTQGVVRIGRSGKKKRDLASADVEQFRDLVTKALTVE